MKNSMRSLAAAIAIAISPMAAAQSSAIDGQVTRLDVTAANRGQALVAGKIASNFGALAGSGENSLALVNALRTGSTVNLVTTTTTPGTGGAPDVVTTTTTTFDPPTGKMGWGNVKISLALAQDVLARAGVTSPTAEQLQTALLGGDIVVTNADGTTTTTTLEGILTQRAGGMGWGEIAKANGTKVGPVVSQLKMAHTRVASIPPQPEAAPAKAIATTGGSKSSAGVTTAAGAQAGGNAKGITTATGASAHAGGKPDRGLTTAAGGSANAGAHGRGKGITTGAGSSTFVSGAGKGPGAGITTAMGGGASAAPKGNAYGRGIVTGGGGGGTNVAATGKPSGAGAGLVTGGGGSAAGITQGGGNAGGNGKGHGRGGKPGG